MLTGVPQSAAFLVLLTGLFLLNPALTTLAALLHTVCDFTRPLPGCADDARQTPRFLPRLP